MKVKKKLLFILWGNVSLPFFLPFFFSFILAPLRGEINYLKFKIISNISLTKEIKY